jgi:hypothetical protein
VSSDWRLVEILGAAVSDSVWNERLAVQERQKEKGTGLKTRHYNGECA